MALGGLSLLGIGDGVYGDEERAHVRDWHDFFVVFAARTLVFFGLVMLQTFVLFFFRDVQKIGNPSAGTALYAFATIVGAVASSIYLGLLSDRVSRKIVTALACASMAARDDRVRARPRTALDAPLCGALRDRLRRRDVQRLGARDGRDSEAA